jgi:hypothetical protein
MDSATRSRAILVASALASLSACHLWYQLVQPDPTPTVRDQENHPVAGATVFFIAAAPPHATLHHESIHVTDHDGVAKLDAEREWALQAPIVPHGVSAQKGTCSREATSPRSTWDGRPDGRGDADAWSGRPWPSRGTRVRASRRPPRSR